MIPVMQTKVVVNKSNGEQVRRGNCFAACIASLLELPIEEVPNVEVFFQFEDSFYWSEVMSEFLRLKGYELMNDNMVKRFHPEFGYSFEGTDENGKISDYYKYVDVYYLVSGKSAMGVSHICIYQNGKLIHDPHPTKEGLISLTNFQTLEKL